MRIIAATAPFTSHLAISGQPTAMPTSAARRFPAKSGRVRCVALSADDRTYAAWITT